MQSYINSYSEENNNSHIIQNPLDIKKETFAKLKIIIYLNIWLIYIILYFILFMGKKQILLWEKK